MTGYRTCCMATVINFLSPKESLYLNKSEHFSKYNYKTMKNILVTLLLIFSAIPLMAQKYDHPIDKYIETCMEKDMSTAGMVECINEGYRKYDDELNRLYKILIKNLDEESAKELKSAQLEWIAFRDKEFKFIDAIYSKLEGTMYIPMRAGDRMEIVKKRVLEFEAYAELAGINIK